MYSKSSAMGGSTLWSSEQELQRALTVITVQQNILGNVLIFIDSLDEYAGDHAAFLNWMTGLIDPSAQQGLKIELCISSRPLDLFEDMLGGFPGLIIHEKTHQDIAAYVRSTINARITRKSREQKGEVELLAEEVVTKASGVSVWVKLVFDDLAQGPLDEDSMSQLRDRLAALPTDLEALYARILHKLNPNYLKEARTIFEVDRSAQGFVTLIDLVTITEPLDFTKGAAFKAIDDTEVQALCSNMERRLRNRSGGLIEAQVDEHLAASSTHNNYTSNMSVESWAHTARHYDYRQRAEHQSAIETIVTLLQGHIDPESAADTIASSYEPLLKQGLNPSPVATLWDIICDAAQVLRNQKEIAASLVSLLNSISALEDITDDHGIAMTLPGNRAGVHWRDLPELTMIFRESAMGKHPVLYRFRRN